MSFPAIRYFLFYFLSLVLCLFFISPFSLIILFSLFYFLSTFSHLPNISHHFFISASSFIIIIHFILIWPFSFYLSFFFLYRKKITAYSAVGKIIIIDSELLYDQTLVDYFAKNRKKRKLKKKNETITTKSIPEQNNKKITVVQKSDSGEGGMDFLALMRLHPTTK